MRTLPAPAPRRLLLPAATSASVEKPSKKKRAKRSVDWAKCKCPQGSEMQTTKRGRACVTKTAKGARRFVAAECP